MVRRNQGPERIRKSCTAAPRSSPLAKGGKRGVARHTNTGNALILLLLGVSAACLVSASALAEDLVKPREYAAPELERLERFYGLWSVTVDHFNTDGQRVGTVKGKEQVTWILDNHAIERNFRSGKKPNVYRAIGTVAWNAVERKYHGVWFDSASVNGPTIAKGDWDEKEQAFVFVLESLGEGGKKIRYKVVESFLEDDSRMSMTFRMDGDRLTKVMDTHYKRAVPCPGGPRILNLMGR